MPNKMPSQIFLQIWLWIMIEDQLTVITYNYYNIILLLVISIYLVRSIRISSTILYVAIRLYQISGQIILISKQVLVIWNYIKNLPAPILIFFFILQMLWTVFKN